MGGVAPEVEGSGEGKELTPRGSTRGNLAILMLIFVASLLVMGVVFANFPELDK